MNKINLSPRIGKVNLLQGLLHVLRVKNRPEENLQITRKTIDAAFLRPALMIWVGHPVFEVFRFVSTWEQSHKRLQLFSEVLRGFTTLALNIVSRLIEESDEVSADLPQYSLQDNICSLGRLQLNFEVFELVRVSDDLFGGILQKRFWLKRILRLF